jgi:hypothetical protein
VKKHHDELGEYSEISKLELHEVTICEKGINPEARFDILKEDKTMNKLEKALAELDTLLEEVNTLRKEEEEPSKEAGGSPHPLNEKMHGEAEMQEYMDTGEEEEGGAPTAAKATTLDGNDDVNLGGAGEYIEQAGLQAKKEGMVSKTFANEEFSTLNLSVANIEKAYQQYRAEQLEKAGLTSLEETFAKRFATESNDRADMVAKSEYDAQSEIAQLTSQFADLRKSLETDTNIRKASVEAATSTKVFSTQEIADMSWSDIHKAVGGNI